MSLIPARQMVLNGLGTLPDGDAWLRTPRVPWPIHTPKPRGYAVELCCGMGGIGIGLAAAGYRVAKAYDSWASAVAIYNHNAPEPVASVCDLVSQGGRGQVARDAKRLPSLDLLAAGPPCKGFSQIRNGFHHQPNDHNQVLLAMPSYVALLRPRMVLIENVPDLMRHNDGRTLHRLLNELANPARGLRYRVEASIYDASLYGTPQARRRMFILGVREGAGTEVLPPPTPDLGGLFAAIRHGGVVNDEMEPYRRLLSDPAEPTMTTARDALSDLPMLEASAPEEPRPYATRATAAFQCAMRRFSSTIVHNTQTPGVLAETVKRLRQIPAGGCARDIPTERLNGLARRYDSAYRRLHADAPSTALSTKYDCVYHYGSSRSLSVREYARLQGIPDDILFPSALACRRHAYEMIGNSVPPLLVHGILGQIAQSSKGGK